MVLGWARKWRDETLANQTACVSRRLEGRLREFLASGLACTRTKAEGSRWWNGSVMLDRVVNKLVP